MRDCCQWDSHPPAHVGHLRPSAWRQSEVDRRYPWPQFLANHVALRACQSGRTPPSGFALAQNNEMKPTMLSRAQAYLAYRRALGFELQSEGIQLLNFARYADATGHCGPLTTELAIRWASLPTKADRRYWASRLENIRRFAKHLLLSEPKTQVPPRHLFGPAYRRNPPHLYSSGEIQHLLRRAGQLK